MTLTFCLVLLLEFSVAKDETQIQVGVLFFLSCFLFCFSLCQVDVATLVQHTIFRRCAPFGGPMVTSKNFSGYIAKCGQLSIQEKIPLSGPWSNFSGTQNIVGDDPRNITSLDLEDQRCYTVFLKGEFKLYYCCSVAKLCLTLCNPMNGSIPGFPVLHYLLSSNSCPLSQ